MEAARDVEPVYYAGHIIDYGKQSARSAAAIQDRIHWFFTMDYAGRRQYSENVATNAFYEPLSWQ